MRPRSPQPYFLRRLSLFLLTWCCVLLLGLPHPLLAHPPVAPEARNPTGAALSRPPLGLPLADLQVAVPMELAQANDSQATTQVQEGMALYQAGRYQDAIALWQQAVDRYQGQGDRLGQAMVLNQMAQAYQALRQWEPAQAVISRSFALLEPATETSRSGLLLAQLWNIQGLSQLNQGQSEQAIRSWQRAADLYTRAGQKTGRLGSLINLAQAQQSLGFYRQAQAILLQVYQTLIQEPDSRLKAMGLLHLGNILRLTGGVNLAQVNTPLSSQQVLEDALGIAQRLQEPDLVATMLLSLGNTAWADRQLDRAIACYQQAQKMGSDALTHLQAGLNQLALTLDRQQWTIAPSLVPPLREQVQRLPISHASLYARLHLSQSLIKLLQVRSIDAQEILPELEAALAAARSLRDPRAESYALGYQGKVYEQVDAWTRAQTSTEQALLVAQNMTAPDITYQWEWQLGRILRRQHQPQLARVAFAQAYENLKSLRQDLIAVNPEIQFNFREQVEPVYRDYIDLLVPSGQFSTRRTAEVPHGNAANLIEARQVLESFRLAELTNFLGSNCLQPVAIDQIAQVHDAAILYPIMLPDRLAVIVSLPNELLSYTVDVTQDQVTEVVDRLRREWEKPYTSPQGKQLSQQLERWLIQPIDQHLSQAQIKTLVFVLDGNLRNVPMAALYNGRQYLIERYAVALAPGLTLLAPSPLKEKQFNALLVGLTQARQGFPELVNVAPEIQTIQSLMPSQVLLNETFTKKNLQTLVQAAPFSIVHLATHGQFGSTVDQTFILTWDGRLNVNELRNLLQTKNQAIDLLVLSACETAAGDERAALGLAGVAVQSGTRRTLASLWSVDDQSGAVFIRYFYEALVKGTGSSADALRQAQRLLLKNPSYRHPRYWAPYVLLGSWL
ncbi:hypothetical protein BST81_08175 [Leptolyngbya sp. 'hensonii']|uniref:CHAT domain-containing protein n=1 Tax=Leptolyngbya sp. 'hensonii' TaxID=1922337 RepID=UPI00094FC27E|nr:CHAT domain-containing protein [Leptolyngbya sp. 'hensonii']OLP18882.1 hypothetical protein BST81_08175 [Leptolyngbya sp. 'hensonii']